MSKPNAPSILTAILVRLIGGIAVFAVLFLGAASIVGRESAGHEQDLADCDWQSEAQVLIGGESYLIPAWRRVAIEGRTGHETLEVRAVLERPWDSAPLGFCPAHLESMERAHLVRFEAEAAVAMAHQLGVDNARFVRRVHFGIEGWHQLNPSDRLQGDPTELVLHRRAEDLNWQYYATPGATGGFRYSTWCSATHEPPLPIQCSLRIRRESDELLIEVWSIRMPTFPDERAPVPEVFTAIADRFDLVLAQFASR